MYEGAPHDHELWAAMFWFDAADSNDTIRQMRKDGKWYIVHGLCRDARVLDGPFESKEVAEMMYRMGVSDG